jgi:hypothetical protein
MEVEEAFTTQPAIQYHKSIMNFSFDFMKRLWDKKIFLAEKAVEIIRWFSFVLLRMPSSRILISKEKGGRSKYIVEQ